MQSASLSTSCAKPSAHFSPSASRRSGFLLHLHRCRLATRWQPRLRGFQPRSCVPRRPAGSASGTGSVSRTTSGKLGPVRCDAQLTEHQAPSESRSLAKLKIAAQAETARLLDAGSSGPEAILALALPSWPCNTDRATANASGLAKRFQEVRLASNRVVSSFSRCFCEGTSRFVLGCMRSTIRCYNNTKLHSCMNSGIISILSFTFRAIGLTNRIL